MEIEFLIGHDIEYAIGKLIAEHDQFHWAVAWGTYTSLAKKLLSQPDKIRAVTFGLAFAQTDPNLVDSLVGLAGSFVITDFPNETYHPKIYAFRSGERVAAIIGSANFTRGGLGDNHEASVLITGSIHDRVLAEILIFTDQSAKLGTAVTDEIALRYRLSCKLASRRPRPPRDPFIDLPAGSVKFMSSPLVGWNWRHYVHAVRGSAYHNIDESLNLLRTAQAWLTAERSFYELGTPQRKAIAGVIGEQERMNDDALNQNWASFGSMRGAGDFKNRISENDRFLASAIDSIPQKGEVTRKQFDRFRKLFVKAFDTSHRVGGVATASRLLAMKRPDVFLCVSSPNITAAALTMRFSKTTLNLENYWDRVIQAISASDWYNIDKPKGSEGQIWECRAAMLDAIFYNPK